MASDAEQGQLQAAPESFLSKDLVENISRDGINPGRRSLLQGAFTAAAASMGMESSCWRYAFLNVFMFSTCSNS